MSALSPSPSPSRGRGERDSAGEGDAVVKAVLFDLDGTFADTAPDLASALNHVRGQRGLPPLPLEAVRPQASHGARGLLKLGFGIEPDAPDFAILRESFLNYYDAHICVHTTLFAGMAQLVATLEQRSLPWGIVTNKPHRFTVPLMQALGYAQRAACLISGDTCTRAKPYPDPLLKASELLDVEPQHCLFLGDDLRDMEAAQAAGMRSIIARYGYIDARANPDSWHADGDIDSPLALLNYI
ncbi:MAG: HAD-IA family hydrolase [Betaproteobacteria bacterium]|nr:HAD-IA family hydrolase [Betaproteobacteria bacterium]MDE2310176.1 HAD-IA family hydrolase [Betaproteobacteria bacterium]